MLLCFWKDAINSMAYFTFISGKPDTITIVNGASKQRTVVITMTAAIY